MVVPAELLVTRMDLLTLMLLLLKTEIVQVVIPEV